MAKPNVRDPQSLFGSPRQIVDAPKASISNYDAAYRGKKNERNAFLISTAEGNLDPIEFWINPSECSWRVPLRTTIEAIQGGAVHHEWDAIGVGVQRQQKFDQPVINFTFQAGNIAPLSWMDVHQVSAPTVMPAGVGNFYDFLSLLNEPNITTLGTPNYIEIQYKSLLMPSISLQGFFTQEGVQWTDNSDNPNGISSWGASFVVFASAPAMFDGTKLRAAYTAIFG